MNRDTVKHYFITLFVFLVMDAITAVDMAWGAALGALTTLAAVWAGCRIAKP
jgi:hypothetical protein